MFRRNNSQTYILEKEDHPARLIDQLAWMTEIGFSDLDVIWKYYNFAVYGGMRP